MLRRKNSTRWRCYLAIFAAMGVSFLPDRVAVAANHPCAIGSPISGSVVWVEKSNGFRLVDGDQIYSLSGLFYPADNMPAEFPVAGTIMDIYPVTEKTDRYGRLAAHFFVKDQWLAGKELAAGRGLAFAGYESAPCRVAMFAEEAKARTAKSGLWLNSVTNYKAGEVDQLKAKTGHFAIVEGQELSVGDRKSRLYLNFGKKWSQDFTALVVKRGASAFKGDIDALRKLRGKSVRVRGILEESGGPMIRLVREGQIEVDDP